jgi:TATA-binding protein-associated factor
MENFNLDFILKSGLKLLSSDTQKYEIKDSDLNLSSSSSLPVASNGSKASNNLVGKKNSTDPTESIREQRKLLNSKLGIDVGGAANLDTRDIFTDEDLLMASSTTTTTLSTDIQTKMLIKRKLSQENQFDLKAENIDIKQSVEEIILSNDSSGFKKIKSEFIESSSSTPVEQETKIKPLEHFTKWLVEKLFNSDWESRHGASTSLREVLKKISFAPSLLSYNSNGNGSSSSSISSKLNVFFEYCLVKLLSVIALDRFADYIGDEAVAPVRETCAQIIGIISSHLNQPCVNMNRLAKLCQVLNSFIQIENENCWEIRHSGIMSLKYTIAASAAMKRENINNLKLIFDLTFENILKCLKDNDDDVRHVASTALEPVSSFLNDLLDVNKIELLIRILIDVLVNKLDDLATSCSNIMSLLSDLLTIKSNSLMFLRLLNGQSIIPHLIVFFQHSSIQVKKTALETINKIIIAINDNYQDSFNQNITFNFEAIETKENLVLLFRLLFQQAILLPSEHAFQIMEDLIEQLWSTLCNKLSIACIINVCFPYITTWVLLMMHSPNQPIDSCYLVHQTNSFNSNNTHQFNEQSKEYIGSNQIKFEEKSVKDLVIIKCRLLAARMLAKLFNRIALSDIDIKDTNSNEKPINVIVNFLCSQINFKSGIQRFCFGLLMIEWGKLMFKVNKDQLLNDDLNAIIINDNNSDDEKLMKMSDQIIQKVSNSLEESTIYFDEIAMLFTRLQKDTRNLINILLKFDSATLSNYLNQSVFTFEDVTSICNIAQACLNDTNLIQIKLNLSKNLKIEIQTLISNLIDLNQQTSQEQEVLQVRSSSSLASASIAIQCQSQRMNPLIRPLMDSIRFETNQDLQQIASRQLAILLAHARIRSPNPIPKIFKNILTYLSNDPVRTPVLQLMSSYRDFSQTPGKDPYENNRYYGILSDKSYVPPSNANGNGN